MAILGIKDIENLKSHKMHLSREEIISLFETIEAQYEEIEQAKIALNSQIITGDNLEWCRTEHEFCITAIKKLIEAVQTETRKGVPVRHSTSVISAIDFANAAVIRYERQGEEVE
jgi:hypothetical protein